MRDSEEQAVQSELQFTNLQHSPLIAYNKSLTEI